MIHPHVKRATETVQVDLGGNIRRIMTVETDLAISPGEQSFDQNAFDTLLEASIEFMNINTDINRVDIRKFGWQGEL